MKLDMTTPEILSVLADGQASVQELAAALAACSQDDAALDCWNTYHLIGDFLRSPADLRACRAEGGDIGFARRLGARLAQEAVAMAVPANAGLSSVSAGIVHHHGPASNDSSFRWKLVAGVASLVAVSVIAWNASGLMAPASGPELVQASSPQIVVTSPQGPVVRDARLEELLAAHRQFGVASALQDSSGFLRNATFEASANAQAGNGR